IDVGQWIDGDQPRERIEQRMIVAFGDKFPRGKIAVGTRNVLDNDRPCPARRKSLGKKSGYDVKRLAGKIRGEHTHRTLRPGGRTEGDRRVVSFRWCETAVRVP